MKIVKGWVGKDPSKELLVELRKDQAYREVNDLLGFYMAVGAEIAKARQASGLSVSDLAVKVGKTEAVIRRMERGEYKQYTLKLLLDMARATKMELHLELKKPMRP